MSRALRLGLLFSSALLLVAASKPDRARAELTDLLVGKALAHEAARWLGQPYHWGGETPAEGFDCSGYTRFVHGQLGISIPKRALEQFTGGQSVEPQSMQEGDLVFFAPSGGGASLHVGLYEGRGCFLHAPGSGKRITRASLNSPFFKLRFMGVRRWRTKAANPPFSR